MMDIADKILGPADVSHEADPFETIAGELATAIESKDHKMMAKALKAFNAMQATEPDEDDSGGE
jgi:hypothetical protein